MRKEGNQNRSVCAELLCWQCGRCDSSTLREALGGLLLAASILQVHTVARGGSGDLTDASVCSWCLHFLNVRNLNS